MCSVIRARLSAMATSSLHYLAVRVVPFACFCFIIMRAVCSNDGPSAIGYARINTTAQIEEHSRERQTRYASILVSYYVRAAFICCYVL